LAAGAAFFAACRNETRKKVHLSGIRAERDMQTGMNVKMKNKTFGFKSDA
jgi:hypothetical protein